MSKVPVKPNETLLYVIGIYNFAKLVSEMDNYSLTDLEKELKSVFADYITSGGQFAFSGKPEEKPVVSQKKFAAPAKDDTPSRYGNLFK